MIIIFNVLSKNNNYYIIYHFIDATIAFDQSTYNVDENDKFVQPVLILSNPSSIDITVQIIGEDDTAKSKFSLLPSIKSS